MTEFMINAINGMNEFVDSTRKAKFVSESQKELKILTKKPDASALGFDLYLK
jgi:hypothetical protein